MAASPDDLDLPTPDPGAVDDLLDRAAEPDVPELARDLAAVVAALRVQLARNGDAEHEAAIRRDERLRLAALLEQNGSTIAGFLGGEGLSIELLVFLLRLDQ